MSNPIEFVDHLPGSTHGNHSTVKADLLAQLRANPGQWAIVRRFRDNKTHSGITTWITKDTDDIESRQRTVDGELRIYARAVAR